MIKAGIVFKNFSKWTGQSYVGLHSAAYNIVKVLQVNDIDAQLISVENNVDLFYAIRDEGSPAFTHIILLAPWISALDLKALLSEFPTTQFAVLSHSNVGFLHADYRAVSNLRDYIEISQYYPNLRVGGNTERFTRWLSDAFDFNALLLPNLYYIPLMPLDSWLHENIIRIGAFGSQRIQKNFTTALAAALIIQKRLGTEVHFYMTRGGENNQPINEAMRQMGQNIPGFSIHYLDWVSNDEFLDYVAAMDLLLQPSYTESFNMITADGITQGVPSVVSPAITWAPDSWKADPDDAVEVAEVGLRLLLEGPKEGLNALRKHNRKALKLWKKYLGIKEKGFWETISDSILNLLVK
jgi:hypothetical protein